jgi:hypothetical protein
MKRRLGPQALVLVALSCVTCAAPAATLWDEASNGDFSNDGLAPTSLFLASGLNSILGTTGNSGQGVDRDYFSFVVPAGATLTSIKLLDNTNVSGGASFLGLQVGPQITVTPEGGGAANLLGFLHYTNDLIGQNLLPALAGGNGGVLPSGTYSAWVQETGGPATYGFEFSVSSVPLPCCC